MSFMSTLRAQIKEWETSAVNLLNKMRPEQPQPENHHPYTPEHPDNHTLLRNTTLTLIDPETNTWRLTCTAGSTRSIEVDAGDYLDVVFTDPTGAAAPTLESWSAAQTPLMVYAQDGQNSVLVEENNPDSFVHLTTNL